MNRARRSAAAAAAASLITLAGAFAAQAATGAGVKGDPQPELKPFEIGASTGPGSVALEPSGGIVVAYQVARRGSNVCLLKRGGHACTSKVTLTYPHAIFGTTEVFVPSANHVDVLQETTTTTYVTASTDGGKTFGSAVNVGPVPVGAAALVGGDIVWVGLASGTKTEVQATPAASPGAPGSVATLKVPGSPDMAVGSYRGGVLIGSDNSGSGPTYVEYAPSGKDFNATASYGRVAKIAGESLLGMSGNALLTVQTGGKQHLEVRFFNGTSFGKAHAVPDSANSGLGTWVTIGKDAGGVTHVFVESSRSSPMYHLFEYSTTTGAHWTEPLDLGNAIKNNMFSVALDSQGSGLVLGNKPAWGYPVLAPQHVTFALKSSSIKVGQSTTGSGKASPAGAGRKVELQVERSGRWYDVASTTEKSSGAFSFTIKGTSAGSHTYRAVVSDRPGYLLFGYSPGRTLQVRR